MSIASEIARLQAAKVDIMAALVEKGVDVTGKNLEDVPDLIDSIEVEPKNIVHIGEHDYPYVKIGNLLWLARNLDENLGHLGNQYEDFTSTSILGYYYTNSSNIGEVVTINRTTDPVWSCVIVDVKAGDFVKLNAHSGNTPKAYIYVDESNVLKKIAEPAKGYYDFEIQCDVDGKVYVSDANNYGTFYVKRKNVGSANEWYYNNDEATAKAKNFGRLYSFDNLTTNIGKLSSGGWRLPKKEDCEYLLAISPDGVKLCSKEWNSGTDDFGFSALASGIYAPPSFSASAFNMWTDTKVNNTVSYRFRIQERLAAFVETTQAVRGLGRGEVKDLFVYPSYLF